MLFCFPSNEPVALKCPLSCSRNKATIPGAASRAPDWRKALAGDVLLHSGIRELDAPLAVCTPHA